MVLNPAFSLFSIINIIGIVQAIFFSILLLRLKQHPNKAHLFLAVFLINYSLIQLGETMEDSKYILNFPHLSQLFGPLVFTLGPLIYFYVLALTQKDLQFRLKSLLHFVPYIVLIILLVPYYKGSAQEKIKYLIEEYRHPDTDLFIPYAGLLQVLVYLILCTTIIRKNSLELKKHFSFFERINLKWLIYLIGTLLVIWFIWLLDTWYPINFLKYMEAMLFTAFIYTLGYKGINQPIIFYNINTPQPEQEIKNDKNKIFFIELPLKKYEKSGISIETIENIIFKLNKSMEQDKLYRNELLTLSQLSSFLEIPGHHLSQVLNEYMKVNFYDYINRYRVDEVKIELLNPEKNKLTIFALALDAGFNSKASFNKAFKKYVGMTPSAYKSSKVKN